MLVTKVVSNESIFWKKHVCFAMTRRTKCSFFELESTHDKYFSV